LNHSGKYPRADRDVVDSEWEYLTPCHDNQVLLAAALLNAYSLWFVLKPQLSFHASVHTEQSLFLILIL
jgi:hypothetical protein